MHVGVISAYHLEEAMREVDHLHALTEAFIKQVAERLSRYPDLSEQAIPSAGRLGKELDLLEEAVRILKSLAGDGYE